MGEQKISQLKPKRSISRARKRRWAFVIVCLAAVGLLWAFSFELSVVPEGKPVVNLEYGSRYEELGASVHLCGSHILKDGIVLPFLRPVNQSDVNTNALGRYTVSYSVSFLGKKAEAQRQVCVIDTVCPEIAFSRDWGARHVDILYGITATDNYDGDITDRVTYTRTNGWVTYSVMDSSGNPTYIVRELPTGAENPPEIALEGDNPFVMTVGKPFEEPGFAATDGQGQDLTEFVTVEGEVDWLTPGTYTLTYQVSDSFENTVSVARDVTVEAVSRPQVEWPEGKTVYLTFDDGPGPYTAKLLEVLARYNAKATFFVTDSGSDSLMQDIVRGGHSIGIHTVNHNYAQIYSSPEAYFEDLYAMQDVIYENTGVMTTLLRFPGGSSNLVSKDASPGIMTTLTEAVQDAGFQYFDWNVDSGDSADANTAEAVSRNVIEGIGQQKTAIVLQHDIHNCSVEAVESILKWGRENGYSFRALTQRSPGFHHTVKN